MKRIKLLKTKIKRVAGLLTSWERLGILYIFIAGAVSHIFRLSEAARSFLALPGLAVMPYALGALIVDLVARIVKRQGVLKIFCGGDRVSLFAIKLFTGLYFLTITLMALSVLHFGNARVFCVFGLIMLLVELIREVSTQKLSSVLLAGGLKDSLGGWAGVSAVSFIIMLLAGVTPVILFKIIQPFPLPNGHSVFLDSYRAVQFLGEGLTFVDATFLPVFPILASLNSLIFNVSTFPLFWVVPFLFYIAFASGTFYFSYRASNSRFIAVMSALISVWIFYHSQFRHLELGISRGLLLSLFPLMLYIVGNSFSNFTISNRKYILYSLSALILLLIIFAVKTKLINYHEPVNILLFLLLPVVLMLISRKIDGEYLTLFFLFIFIMMIHLFEGLVYCFLIYIYATLLMLNKRYEKRSVFKSASVILILAIVLFFWLSRYGIIMFHDNFVLSKYVFGAAYQEATINLSFPEKYSLLKESITTGMLLLSFASLLLISVIYKEHTLVISVVSAIILFLFAFPEGNFVRVIGLLIPFLSITVSSAISWLLTRFRENGLRAVPAIFTTFLVSVVVFTQVASPMIGKLEAAEDAPQLIAMINEDEYDVARWIEANFSSDVFVLSDPYTSILLLKGIVGSYTYAKRGWIYEGEYAQEDLDRMSLVKSRFFQAQDSETAYGYALSLEEMLSTNYSLEDLYYLTSNPSELEVTVERIPEHTPMIVVVTARTSSWIKSKTRFIATSPPGSSVAETDWTLFTNTTYFTPLYSIKDKVYVFGVNPEPGKPFEIETLSKDSK